MENKKTLIREVLIPEGITITIAERIVTVKGDAEISKKITTKRLTAEVKEGKVILKPNVKKSSKTEKKLINTLESHIKNMIKGVKEPYVYKLKICSSHFPMGVALKGQEIEVTNFIGEKVSRVLKIKEGADVKIEGEIITVTSPNKECAGQIAADIEKMVKRPRFDRRIFMDGIYIIEKAGVPIK
ncbi:50S ribosomal protein L6 [Candidatus Woesearchaeota archaeon]|jgi:large subunit ribosomal protein L6|nr:50S ribosomal protein L6 [Candidatus Woesearchaeota archaeon]MBT4368704.1 50S ribosomal protein L6 [Candidatus Woesearchaeota archaeon]MBT4711993.1 50S ribosomal protein L6 [Candidatus Woesearchaeota archaeon]MBT6638888.1 50S ribosomal protein L6 [Candidatus Woesearchaeota archaeon]MBT7134532.1 50S ribosomal protein L6 [Candidatus Woesearchaeota archaeon]